MSVGNASLTVVATQNWGGSAIKSPSVVVAWRWYYHAASIAFWALALVPLVVMKENRRAQAWSIVGVLLAVILAPRMALNLLAESPATVEGVGEFVAVMATGWTIVWLLGPWYYRRPAIPAFALMLAVSGLHCLASGLCGVSQVSVELAKYAFGSLGVIVPVSLASRFYRCERPSARFQGLVFLWSVALGAGTVFTVNAVLSLPSGRPDALFMTVMTSMIGGLFGGIICLVNLPFLILAAKVPFYQRRFLLLWGCPKATGVPEADSASGAQQGLPPQTDL